MHNGRISKKLSNLLVQASDGIAKWSFYFASSLLLGMALSTTYDMIMRYFFTRPTIWSQDLNENSLVYACYLSSAWILREDRHVAVNIFTDTLNPQRKRLVDIITSTLGAITCGILCWKSFEFTLDLFVRGELHIRSLVIPKWVSYAPIPLGTGLLCIFFLRKVCNCFRTPNI